MSSRKNILSPYKIFNSASMAGDLTSPVTTIQYLDNIGVQLQWTGDPEGNFFVEVSADYAKDEITNTVKNAGTWIPITLNPSPVAPNDTNTIYIDLNQLSAPYVRVRFENTFIESADIATVADSSGSLNNKYFLIDGADGDDWYVWYDNGSGVDPMVPSRTGIQVTYADNDSANTIASLTRAALAACTSIENIGGATNHILFDQTVVGDGSVANGAASPGFTITQTAASGSLTGYITAKML